MTGARPSAGLLAAGGLASGLVLLPLAVTVWSAAGGGAELAGRILLRPLVVELLVNTFLILFCACVGAALIGTAAAWCIERTRFPGQKFFAVLVVVPLAIPPFISSYGWVSLSTAFQDFWGALIVITCSYTPLVYLPVAAALKEMDPALEETARGLGLGPARIFARIILPQLRPALLGGVLLVALNVLVEFGAFALLRFRTFTTAIYSEYRAGFSDAEPALLALVLVALCVLCLAAEFLIRGRARYGRIGKGTRRAAQIYALGPARHAVAAGFVILALVGIGVPLGMILYWLTQTGSAATTAAAYSLGSLLGCAWASIYLGVLGAALTLALALPLGVLAVRHDGPLVTLLERAAYLAQGVPGIVVALALVTLTVHAVSLLYQSVFLLLLAYAVVFLPLALISVRSALVQAQKSLEEAGRSLGLNRWAVLLRITLPLAAPGLGAAAAMVFIAIVTELTATLLLAPIGTRTLATQIWADTSTVAFAAAAPYAAVLAALSMVASWALARRFGAASVFAGGAS